MFGRENIKVIILFYCAKKIVLDRMSFVLDRLVEKIKPKFYNSVRRCSGPVGAEVRETELYYLCKPNNEFVGVGGCVCKLVVSGILYIFS